ncbi:MAG TPA: tetratricopeptide repeat protein [Actinomycetota bacterium]|nr:tetratricopeptide repeat protein [Actinomycetota bacterium]
MTSLCSRCGAELPGEARFCPRCGAPAEMPLSAERKVVSVLFADLTESTRLASSLDPERFRELQGAFYREASERIGELRGRTEKFVGDSVMAVFGVPTSHDDDALRAVRAGMEIRDRIARLGEELGLPAPLQVRIGINSGPVIVGSGPADQFLASGTAVNLAARLQQAADPGEILAGDMTRQLTINAVSFGDTRAVEAKGFDEPVSAWAVKGLSARSSRRTIPIIGRRRELSMLRESLERARESSRLHLVTVLGEPGIGKSRLVEELLSCLDDDVVVLRGRAGRFEEDALFAALGDMLRDQIGVKPSDPPETTLEMLRARVAEVVGGDATQETVDRLALALGIGTSRDAQRQYQLAEVRAGLISYLGGLTRGGSPVVIALEDLELAPADLLELIEQLAVRGRRLPVLIVCAGRDEMLHTMPGWPGGIPDSMTIRLESLTDEEAVDLARASAASLADETAERVARHAGGNPFFIVETTGMLIHEQDERGDAVAPPLPATVHAVVAARIDHLDARSREVVRKASVFANSAFNVSDLAMVAEPSEEALSRLEDEELLVRDRDRPERWRFRHQVVRDVAYDSLAKRERLHLHLAVADQLGPTGQHPVGMAHHLERAARAAHDLDPSDRSIAERAVDALHEAGDIARRRMDSRTAIERYERALALAGPEGAWTVREAHTLCGIGEAQYWLGEFLASRATLERALALAPDETWTASFAHRFLGDIALNVEGEIERAQDHFNRALRAARELEPPDGPFALARTLLVAAWVPFHSDGNLDRANAMFQEALEVATTNPDGDPWAVARALTFLASVISMSGNEADTLPLVERAYALGKSMKDPFTTAVAQHKIGGALMTLGRFDDSLPHFEAAIATFREIDARWELASAISDLGEGLRHHGRLREAESLLREGLAITRELGERQLVGWLASELARCLHAQGRKDEARATMTEAATYTDLSNEISAWKFRTVQALEDGDEKSARAIMENGIEQVRARGSRPNSVARIQYYAGRLLGPEAVGGQDVLDAARKRLVDAGWFFYLDDPDFPDA